jgi:Na+/melibiose symporter-like transporter
MRERADGSGGLLSPEGYAPFAWFAGGVIFVSLLTCTAGLHRRICRHVLPQRRRLSFRGHVAEMTATLKSRSFAILAGAAVFLSIGSGLGGSLSLYWLMYYYRFTQAEMSLMAIPVMLGMFLTVAAPAVGRRFGKRNAALILLWVHAVSVSLPLLAMLLGLVPESSAVLIALVVVQAILGAAAMTMVLITLSSMISDLVEEAQARTGRRQQLRAQIHTGVRHAGGRNHPHPRGLSRRRRARRGAAANDGQHGLALPSGSTRALRHHDRDPASA